MQKPGNSHICISDQGEPWLRGFRCTQCGARAEASTLACRRCHARNCMEEYQADSTGKLVTWSIVYRSYPGIEVPFVSAVVELDDGLTLKGNVTGCDHDDLHMGMPVTLAFNDAGGAKDKEGNGFVAYHFEAQPSGGKDLTQ